MRDPTEDEQIRNPGGSRGFRTGLERYPHALVTRRFFSAKKEFFLWERTLNHAPTPSQP